MGERRRQKAAAGASGPWLLVLAALVLLGVTAAPAVGAGAPRTANIHFPVLANASPEKLERLSRYDLLVVVASNGEWSPDQLGTLRRLNPDIVILPHMCFSYHGDWASPSIYGDLRDTLYAYDWWLKDPAGQRYYQPNGNGLINVTTNCPTNPRGQRFCDWYGDYLASRLGPGGPWDGVFLDLCIDEISWVVRQTGSEIDSDGDGVPDDLQELDADWTAGTAIAVSRLRELVGEDYLLVSNGGNTLYDQINGSTLEQFPEAPAGWYENINDPERGYIAIDTRYREPRFNIINPVWYIPVGEEGPLWSGYFIKKFTFTLASTLVFGGGYYSLNSTSYCESWWYHYYDIELGEPLGQAQDAAASPGDGPGIEWGDMIKLRRFSRGVAAVNPTNVTQAVELGGQYYDVDSWNGEFYPRSSARTTAILSSKMGCVLVGAGALPLGVTTVTRAAFDGTGVELEWDAVPWASRYAVYRSGVRGDGSLAEPTLVAVSSVTSCVDQSVEPERRYGYSVAPIDDMDCEGQGSEVTVVATEFAGGPSVALMVEEPDGTIVVTWTVPDVPGDMIFELERIDDKGDRQRLGRWAVEAGETQRFGDETAEPGRSYLYELFAVRGGGRSLVASVRARAPEGDAVETALLGCRPQPAHRGRATIAFRVGDDGRDAEEHVTLTVFDIRGRAVRRVLDRRLAPGDHSVLWDCRDGSGRTVATGCYLYALEVGRRTLTGKLVIVD